jgi:hypothetical protein
MTCAHWTDIGVKHGGRCNLHQKTCSFGVCSVCKDTTEAGWWRAWLRKVRLGDKVESATKAVGIKPCGGCGNRKTILNGEG